MTWLSRQTHRRTAQDQQVLASYAWDTLGTIARTEMDEDWNALVTIARTELDDDENAIARTAEPRFSAEKNLGYGAKTTNKFQDRRWLSTVIRIDRTDNSDNFY